MQSCAVSLSRILLPLIRLKTAIAPYLPASLLPDALEIARTIMSECSRAEALTALVPYLPEVLPEVLDVARTIMSEYSRAEALTAL